MAVEIERKFLVAGEFLRDVSFSHRITQGYLSSGNGKTVRVRTWDDKGYLTVKGPSADGGLSRFEWEIEISSEDAESLLMLCDKKIDKTRHIVEYKGHTFEVDEFYGDNQGLVIAEIELKSVDETFEKPSWLGQEVTGDRRYYNSALTEHPFKSWK